MPLLLDQIEPEVVQIILEYVAESSPKSVKAVACVNRYLNECLRAVQHRHKVIRVHQPCFTGAIAVPWAEDATALRNINRLSVLSSTVHRVAAQGHSSGENFEAFWQPLANAIRSISKLKVLEWRACAIPLNVLKALEEKHPAASLQFDRWNDSPTSHEMEELYSGLGQSKQLTHFRAVCQDRDAHFVDRFLTNFMAIVSSAPNLREVRLNVSGKHGMQLDLNSMTPPSLSPENAHALKRKKHKLPQVRHLTLDGPQIVISEDTLQKCAASMQLDSLESVKFSRGQLTAGFFEAASSLLPNLKHLSLNFRSVDEEVDTEHLGKGPICVAARSYLTRCSQLESLHLWSWRKVVKVEEIVQCHGPTLRSLQLHESELEYPCRPSSAISSRPFLKLSELSQLRMGCPALQELSFDMNLRHGDAEPESNEANLSILDDLAQFDPQLRKVEVYFDSGRYAGHYDLEDSDPDGDSTEDESLATIRALEPPDALFLRSSEQNKIRLCREGVMMEHAQYMWKRIYAGNMAGARRLDVKIGEWESRMHPAYDRRRSFRVFPHERDDRLGQSVVKMERKYGYSETRA